MNDRIPNLTIERREDGSFVLEQDNGSTIERVGLHESQARHLAIMAGLMPADSTYMPPGWVLARRLRVLKERINDLDDQLRRVAASGHEVLDEELVFSMASWELAIEFCADLAPPQQGPHSSPAITPEATVSRSSEGGDSLQLELRA